MLANMSVHLVAAPVVLLRRFKPNNIMHVVHDDLLPLFHTLRQLQAMLSPPARGGCGDNGGSIVNDGSCGSRGGDRHEESARCVGGAGESGRSGSFGGRYHGDEERSGGFVVFAMDEWEPEDHMDLYRLVAQGVRLSPPFPFLQFTVFFSPPSSPSDTCLSFLFLTFTDASPSIFAVAPPPRACCAFALPLQGCRHSPRGTTTASSSPRARSPTRPSQGAPSPSLPPPFASASVFLPPARRCCRCFSFAGSRERRTRASICRAVSWSFLENGTD
jgi:hypothetical protein